MRINKSYVNTAVNQKKRQSIHAFNFTVSEMTQEGGRITRAMKHATKLPSLNYKYSISRNRFHQCIHN